MGRVKGICYGNDAFPAPYNPSVANSTQVFFGSDNTADYIGSLFRSSYANSVQPWCQSMAPGETTCRADLPKMYTMGVEVIRLYDWDPRNAHDLFLDACHNEKIGVLVSVSNYFLQPGGGLPDMNKQIPALIQSFSQGSDYHPAVQGLYLGMSLICLATGSVSRIALLLQKHGLQSSNSNFRTIAKCQSGIPSVLLCRTTACLVGMLGINSFPNLVG